MAFLIVFLISSYLYLIFRRITSDAFKQYYYNKGYNSCLEIERQLWVNGVENMVEEVCKNINNVSVRKETPYDKDCDRYIIAFEVNRHDPKI